MWPRYPWEKQATATQRETVRQLLELMPDAGGNLESQEELVPTSASLALVAPTVSFGSSRDSQESPTVPEPIVREQSFMESAEHMALEALRLAMLDSPPSQKLKTAAFQASSGFRAWPFLCSWWGGGGQVGFRNQALRFSSIYVERRL